MSLRASNQVVALIGIAMVALLLACSPAQASGITLDASFGSGGSVTTDFARGSASAKALAVQSDGKVVAVGGSGSSTLAATRFNTDGSVDSSYGTGGRLALGAVPDGTGYTDGIRAAGLVSGDKLIVGGTTPRVARLSSAGALDATFDDPGLWSNYGVLDLAVQPDGKTVIVSHTSSGAEFVRYTPDGHLDATFSGDGRQIVTLPSSGGWGLTIASDGDIVAVGSKGGDVVVVRLTSSGSPDPGWGTDGVVTTDLSGDDRGIAATPLPNGAVAVAASKNTWTPALIAYESDGDLDTTFSGDGIVTAAAGSVATSGLTRDSTGALYLAAGGSSGTIGASVWKFTAAGTPDSTFGTGGVAAADLSGAGDIAVAGGKVLLAGSAGRSLAVARLTASGAPDPSWSGDGVATLSFGGGMDVAGALLPLADGGLMVGGQVPRLAFAVGRYSGGGALDGSFGSAGLATLNLSTVTDLSGAVTAMRQQADGKVVALGTNQNGGIRVVRFQTSGAPDSGFGTPTYSSPAGNVDVGFPTFTTPLDIFVRPDQKLQILGNSGSSIHLARLTPGGALDATFDGDGMAQATVPGTTSTWVLAVAQQPDGKTLLAGRATKAGSFDLVPFVARLTSAGAMDTSFSDDGVILGDSAGNVSALAIDSDGRVLAAGSTLARYQSDGKLDSSFSGDGVAPVPSGGEAVGVYPDSTGTTLVVSRIPPAYWLGETAKLQVARFTSAGALDSAFSDDGVDTTTAGVPEGLTGSTLPASASALRSARVSGGKLVIAGTQAPGDWKLSRYTLDSTESPGDSTPPQIAVVAPVEGQHVDEGTVVKSQFSCADPGGSGVEACDGPATLDTTSPGSKTLTITALDKAGNRASKSVGYVVDAKPTPSEVTGQGTASTVIGPQVNPPLSIPVTNDLAQSALSRVLSPTGKAASIAAFLKAGYLFTFGAPGPGKIQITWYYLPKGATLAGKPKPLVVAMGSAVAVGAGDVKVSVRANSAGKKKLRKAKSMRITAKATFAPSGGNPLSATKTFVLKR